MFVIRQVTMNDTDQLFELIQRSVYGLTTLKITREQLEERIEQSVFAFSQTKQKPAGQPYVFVLEDLANGQLLGTCTIYSKVGGYEPFYAYRIETSVHESKQLGIRKEIQVLHLMMEHNGPTEIGSLYLSPDHRGGGHGRLLSLSRFLFMAEFPQRFDDEVIAEMRGVVDQHGNSPFWAAVGAHFFEIEFPTAELLTTQSKSFIGDLMPRHPLYIPLLPVEAQETLGVVHDLTRPALAMLEQEGFERRDLIDIFDGGPVVHCRTDSVRAVRDSQSAEVCEIVDQLEAATWLISHQNSEFRVCLGRLEMLAPSDDQDDRSACVRIDKVTALTLQVKLGHEVRFVAPRAE